MNRTLYHLCFFGLIFAFGFMSPILAQDDDQPDTELTLSVSSEDTPLVIRGQLDGQGNGFRGNIRLTVQGGDVTALYMLASDLQHDESDRYTIDRSYVSIPSGTSLTERQPRDVPVTVSNVNRAGNYTGELRFLLPGQEEAAAFVVPVELHISAKPKVVPVSPTLSWQIVRCHDWLNCRMATWFLPDSVIQNQWQVWLDNQTTQAVQVTDGVAILKGNRTGYSVNASNMTLSLPQTLPASGVEPVTLIMITGNLAPDNYEGVLRFRVEDMDEPVLVNVSLNVRQGPVGALIVIVLGILLGRLVRNMETPTAQAQVKLMPTYRRLLAAADSLQNLEAKRDALQQLGLFKKRLESSQETEETLAPTLQSLEARINFYTNLETIARELPDALRNRLESRFTEARKAIIAGRKEDAERIHAEIKHELSVAEKDGSMGIGEELVQFRTRVTTLGESINHLWGALPTKVTSNWLRLLTWISGLHLTADVRFWVIRPVLWFVLLLLLTLMGMQTLYVNAGTAFGASGVYDYLALLIWGLTSDIVSRSFSNLPGKLA